LTGAEAPSIFILTGAPVLKNMSDACFSTISLRYGFMSISLFRLDFGCIYESTTHAISSKPYRQSSLADTAGQALTASSTG
jgi:hypothetical protein